MGPSAVLSLFAIGAAVLAFWTVARFPSFGPQTLLWAILATAAAFGLESELPGVVSRTIVNAGVPVTLLLVVLPALTLLFWTSGCLVRSLIALLAPHSR